MVYLPLSSSIWASSFLQQLLTFVSHIVDCYERRSNLDVMYLDMENVPPTMAYIFVDDTK